MYTTIEPTLPDDRHHDLADAAFELVSAASSLAGQLNPTVRDAVDRKSVV